MSITTYYHYVASSDNLDGENPVRQHSHSMKKWKEGQREGISFFHVLQGCAVRSEPSQDAQTFLAGKDYQHILAEEEGQDLLGIAPMDEPGGVKPLLPNTDKPRHAAPPAGDSAASG